MLRSLTRVWPLLIVLALLAAPASADVYYVTLTNGQVIQTAHQPQQASWDPNMVLMLTEVGNWIGFPKEQIQGVRVEDPTQGYGIRISDKAIALGRSPNDLPTSDDSTKSKADQITDRYLALAERQLAIQEERRNYSVQQFVEPSASAGIPLISYGNNSGAVSGYGGMYLGGTPTGSNGAVSPNDFGGLSGAGSPPQQ
ncbi:MAG: hypothetical protein DMF53_11580 [Acidobacteria bacterium]|nr:MAG: hypothetical protein DMF53_11580 [Acidobacteriota bacterium]